MVKIFLKKAANSIAQIKSRREIKNKIQQQESLGLPKEIRGVLEFLLLNKIPRDVLEVVSFAEERRKNIAYGGEKKVPIWYSPKPNSAGNDESVNARPRPGKVLEFTMEQVAKTGKDQKWGTVIHLIATGFKSTSGIELGSCAGISGIYLSTAPTLKRFITVEGSEVLAGIAKESLKPFSNATVINLLFDEALDLELSNSIKYNLAFIDGHHEKTATLHYFNRLIPALEPGAVVVFDDISWSHDMRESWEILEKRNEFSHTIDLGAIGLCIMKKHNDDSYSAPKNWDLQPLVGYQTIGDPHGWKL